MILIDTSIWVSHFRFGNAHLQGLLLEESVACHPFIIGEMALGHLQHRGEILALLHALPQAQVAEHEEVLRFIEDRRLMGSGLGLVDVHLLASALLTEMFLWTEDKPLRAAAAKLRVLYH